MKTKTKKQNTTYKIVVTAMMAAIATVLNQFAVVQLPLGGGVTAFSQVPIIALGFIFGPVWGLAGGFLMSVSQLLFGLSNFAYVKGFGTYLLVALFDYIIPYTVLGLGGLFKGKLSGDVSVSMTYMQKKISVSQVKIDAAAVSIGAVCVSFLRFLCHWISGAVVWGEWMPEEFMGMKMANPWFYSALYNASYMIPETLVTVVGAIALAKLFFPRLDDNGILK